MEHTHVRVLENFTGYSGHHYRVGEMYEIVARRGSDLLRIKIREGVEVYGNVTSPDSPFLPCHSYSKSLEKVLE